MDLNLSAGNHNEALVLEHLKKTVTDTLAEKINTGKKTLQGHCNYDKKPDCDNLAKSVLDALNGIAYNDDSQITSLHVVKEYGTQPKVILQLKEL